MTSVSSALPMSSTSSCMLDGLDNRWKATLSQTRCKMFLLMEITRGMRG